MLVSFGIIFIIGLLFKRISEKLHLPGLIGLIVAGIFIGPYSLNLINSNLLQLSAVIRKIALIIIIFRAGINLDFDQLKKNKLSVILLSFIPATFEIIAYLFIGQYLLNLSLLDSAILGCVMSAVSPAVIVPNMIKIIEERYGEDKGIPEMIMSASSVDDIYVITIFLALINVSVNNTPLNFMIVTTIIQTILLGVIVGVILGYTYNFIMKRLDLDNLYTTLIIISIMFILDGLEPIISNYVGYSSLLSILSFGMVVNINKVIHNYFSKLWIVFEILLFTLIGSELDLSYVLTFGLIPIISIFTALIVRALGVFISLLKSELSSKERLFVSFSFIPKATVQAGIGPIALSLGLSSGKVILTISIIAILITAPLGSLLITNSYKRLLSKT